MKEKGRMKDGKSKRKGISSVGKWSIVWNGILYVSVGTGGIIQTSADGTRWETQKSGISEDLNDVVWDGGTFYARSKSGRVLVSEDGVSWNLYIEDSK